MFVAISPWNFPLAIFTGQVAAALAAGNAVIAKPAEQTPLIAAQAVALLHEAGVPADVLHLLPGRRPRSARALVADPRIAGVAFTGSTETARAINRALAARDGPIVPLIAETGGQNAMIVDILGAARAGGRATCSSRAFRSRRPALLGAARAVPAGRRRRRACCEMLAGAMQELRIGDPGAARDRRRPGDRRGGAGAASKHHAARDAHGTARLIAARRSPPGCARGTFFAPHAFEIDAIARARAARCSARSCTSSASPATGSSEVVEAINAHRLRPDARHPQPHRRDRRPRGRSGARAGNVYVNRNMIGAVVGVQPFGGERLSGTGPKAGGPHYLPRFATERTVTINTAAVGGNASLLSLDETPSRASGAA